jgi:hypothetical protein
MGCQNPPNDVFVDLDAEGFNQLLGNPGAAETRIALLEFNDGSDQFRGWSLGTRFALAGSGIEPPVLVCLKGRLKSEQGRGFKNHRATQNPARMQKQGPESQEQALGGAERLGARLRGRLIMSSWCLSRRLSPTTALTPPGRSSLAKVAIKCASSAIISLIMGELYVWFAQATRPPGSEDENQQFAMHRSAVILFGLM